ncbi:MAG: hypothetical protein RMJ33_06810 [Saprospiraceae bacterium]|nr:hypothetical protein [Saprospiraceae bacterium]MDW8229532.1 hypothetical protein [Saprospiraceae bacterium]
MRLLVTSFLSGFFPRPDLSGRKAVFAYLLLGALVSVGYWPAVGQPIDGVLETYGAALTPCSDPTISFFMEKDLSQGCPAVRVGLRSSASGKVLRVRKLTFELSFAMSAGLPPADVAFQGWPDVPCVVAGCADGGQCWRWDAATHRFIYCFSSASAVDFALDAEPRVLLLFKDSRNCVFRPGLLRIEMDLELDNGQVETCTPPLASTGMFQVCASDLRVRLVTPRGAALSSAYLRISSAKDCVNACILDSIPAEQGFCDVCSGCGFIRVRPFKNEDPGNGVGTYDIVLIQRHISGEKPLKSLYHLMAADVNRDYAINGADIVALRSLILGMPTTPPVESWRFVDPENIVLYPINPLLSQLPDHIISPNPPAKNLTFVAIKVGDVSGNAVLHGLTDGLVEERSDKRPALPVSVGYAGVAYRKGQIFSVPVTYQGDRPLLAHQMALRFDPQRVAFKGTFAGNLPGYDSDNFGLIRAHEGEIRALWIAPDNKAVVLSQTSPVLFYLTFEALTDIAASEAWIALNHDLPCRLWDDQDEEYAMTLTAPRERIEEAAARALEAAVWPSPASSGAYVSLRLPASAGIQLTVRSADGRLILERRWALLAAGEHVFHLPETATLPAGMYVVEVSGGRERCVARFVKH